MASSSSRTLPAPSADTLLPRVIVPETVCRTIEPPELAAVIRLAWAESVTAEVPAAAPSTAVTFWTVTATLATANAIVSVTKMPPEPAAADRVETWVTRWVAGRPMPVPAEEAQAGGDHAFWE